MKKLLRNFPDNSLEVLKSETSKKTVSVQEIKAVVSDEIQEIKKEIQSSKQDEKLKILGDLLRFLRENKSMSLLMLCRQIDKIELEGNTVVIFSQDDEVQSLVSNERYSQELNSFFKQKGLGFRVHENKHEISPVDELNRILGGKLIVKN